GIGGTRRTASASGRCGDAGKLSSPAPGWARGNDLCSAPGSTAAKLSVLSLASAVPAPGRPLSSPGVGGSGPVPAGPAGAGGTAREESADSPGGGLLARCDLALLGWTALGEPGPWPAARAAPPPP